MLYGSALADGNAHAHHDLPVLVAGRGATWRTGRLPWCERSWWPSGTPRKAYERLLFQRGERGRRTHVRRAQLVEERRPLTPRRIGREG